MLLKRNNYSCYEQLIHASVYYPVFEHVQRNLIQQSLIDIDKCNTEPYLNSLSNHMALKLWCPRLCYAQSADCGIFVEEGGYLSEKFCFVDWMNEACDDKFKLIFIKFNTSLSPIDVKMCLWEMKCEYLNISGRFWTQLWNIRLLKMWRKRQL